MVNAKKKKDSNSLIFAGIIILVVLSLSVLVNIVQNPTVTGMAFGDETEGNTNTKSTGGSVVKELQEGISKVLSFFTGEKDFVTNLLFLTVFIMLIYAFKDIISTVGMFGSNTSWVLGVGLSFIVAITGGLNYLATKLFQAVAAFGAISVVTSLFVVFAVWILFHFTVFSKLKLLIHGKKATAEMEKEADSIVAAGKMLKRIKDGMIGKD